MVRSPTSALPASLPSAEAVAGAGVVAFDPGRNVGIAWVSPGGSLLRHAVIGADELPRVPVPAGAHVVIGDGTGSRRLAASLRALGFHPELVDEAGTSEIGRMLYWRRHPPRGIGRLVPLGLRVPPRPVDDFAAYAIALRVLGGRTGLTDPGLRSRRSAP